MAVNCALPNTQISDLRIKLCMDYRSPGWTSADETAWAIVKQRLKGLSYKGYEGIRVPAACLPAARCLCCYPCPLALGSTLMPLLH